MSDRIAQVTIDNPPMNLGDHVLFSDLARFSAEVRTDDTVGVIVFDSADPEYFYAHVDMVDMADTTVLEQLPQDGTLNFTEELHESYRTLPQVTITKAAGRARGGCIGFFAALDLRFAALEKALFSQNEVRLGAAQAERYGLINRALPADELDGFVERLARRIATFSPEAVSTAERAVDASIDLSVSDGLQEENKPLRQLVNPQVAEFLQSALVAGAQTRQGELDRESLIEDLHRAQPPRRCPPSRTWDCPRPPWPPRTSWPGPRRHPAMPVPAARRKELSAAAVRGPAGFQME